MFQTRPICPWQQSYACRHYGHSKNSPVAPKNTIRPQGPTCLFRAVTVLRSIALLRDVMAATAVIVPLTLSVRRELWFRRFVNTDSICSVFYRQKRIKFFRAFAPHNLIIWISWQFTTNLCSFAEFLVRLCNITITITLTVSL